MFNNSSFIRFSDLCALFLAFTVGQLPRFAEFNWSITVWWQLEGQFRIFGCIIILIGLLFAFGFFYEHYSKRKPFWDELREVLGVLLLLMVIDAAFFFVNKVYFSRLAFALQWLVLIPLLPTLRTLFKLYALKKGFWQIPVRLIGSGNNAKEAWLALKSEGLMGYQLVEVALSPQHKHTNDDWITVPKLLWQEGLNATQDKQIVVALEIEQQVEMEEVVRKLSRFCPNLIIVPPTRGLPLWGMEPLHSFSHEVLLLRSRNNLQNNFAQFLKRSFDIVFSIILLVLLSPLFAYLIFKVRGSEGPAFFKDKRLGRDGTVFYCFKFRSMVVNAAEVMDALLSSDPAAKAEYERNCKLKHDPRITQIGHFLRRSSLDELPQLWNVLRGDMSLVGPRPMLLGERQKYGDNLSYYLQVRPGMTGLWQVSGRSDLDFETRVALDAWYVRNWSFWNDLVILIKTVKVVLQKDGAY